MSVMMLPPGQLARLISDRLRHARSRTGGRAGKASEIAWIVQRSLEEGGVHCETTPSMEDLKGFLIASPRGAEITVSERLSDDERLDLFANLLARAMVENLDVRARSVLKPIWSAAFGPTPTSAGTARAFASHLAYVDGRAPRDESRTARRNAAVAAVLTQAILDGHLELAPRYAFGLESETQRRPGLRPAFGRLVLELCHRFSLALFWRSSRYQRLRANRQVTEVASHIEGMLRRAYAV